MNRTINPTSAAILGLLHTEPMTGGEIVTIAEKWLRPFWNMTRSQVYRELPELAVRGLVKPGKTGPRLSVPYKITAVGVRVFRDWLRDEPDSDILRSEAALRVAFGHLQVVGEVEQMADKLASRHAETLKQITKLMDEAAESDMPFDREALRFAASYHRMCVKWLRSVELPN